MKRVIDAKSYNTDTAEVIAETKGSYTKRYGEDWEYHTVLYRTPKGAWFTVETEWPEDVPEDERHELEAFEVLSLDGAMKWVKSNECTLHKGDYFPSIEEA